LESCPPELEGDFKSTGEDLALEVEAGGNLDEEDFGLIAEGLVNILKQML
jgi:hypothetical protein